LVVLFSRQDWRLEKKLFPDFKMAASSSRQSHQIPLPPSPPKIPKSQKQKISRKGKGKENVVEEPLQDLGNYADLSNPSWDWTHLTDPSASKVPPIFTKDGRYDSLALIIPPPLFNPDGTAISSL